MYLNKQTAAKAGFNPNSIKNFINIKYINKQTSKIYINKQTKNMYMNKQTAAKAGFNPNY